MALAEFAAIESAYRALAPLDPAGRARALAWLSNALDAPGLLAEESNGGANRAAAKAVPPAQETVVKRTRRASKQEPTVPARAKKTAGRKAGSAVKQTRRRIAAAAKASDTAARAYRRMPAAEEVLGAYRQVGTVSGLAEHFGVPRHTVQGWARRLRQDGHNIGGRS